MTSEDKPAFENVIFRHYNQYFLRQHIISHVGLCVNVIFSLQQCLNQAL